MSNFAQGVNELYATWQFSNQIRREIAGLYCEGKILSQLFIGTNTNVKALQKNQSGKNQSEIPFHTHISGGLIAPPSAEDIIQYIYQRITTGQNFPFIVLAKEGYYVVNIARNYIQIISNFIKQSSREDLEKWKCIFIRNVNKQILENLIHIKLWKNYRIKFHNFVIDITLSQWP